MKVCYLLRQLRHSVPLPTLRLRLAEPSLVIMARKSMYAHLAQPEIRASC